MSIGKQRQIEIWKRKLERIPQNLSLPNDRTRGDCTVHPIRSVHLAIADAVSTQLQQLADRCQCSTLSVLVCGLAIVLWRWSTQEEFLIGARLSRRVSIGRERKADALASQVVLHIAINKQCSAEQFIHEIDAVVKEAYANSVVSFEEVIHYGKTERGMDFRPIIQVELDVDEWCESTSDDSQPKSLGTALGPSATDVAQLDLLFTLRREAVGITGTLSYAEDLYTQATMNRLVDQFTTVMQVIADRPLTSVDRISMVSERELELVLERFNDTDVNYHEQSLIHTLIEEQVRRSPEAIAVTSGSDCLTYVELNRESNRLARFLRLKGMGPEHLIAICAERSLDMVIGLLAILKSGAAYVPLDPEYPPERLSYMVCDAGAALLLTQEKLRKSLPVTDAKIVELDGHKASWASLAADDLDAREVGLHPRNLAYVIYTSGSTGAPKGAMNEHHGVVNRLLWMQQQYNLAPADRVLQKTPFSFDVSVWEFFWTLMRGARLIMARPRGHQDPAYLRNLIDEAGVTRLHFVPSMLQLFLDQYEEGTCGSLRQIVCSGEELSVALAQKCSRSLPSAHLSNLYGPTEAAVDVTSWEFSPSDSCDRVPIGRPISNVRVYVLDADWHPAPVRVADEIYLGGVGVGRGYFRRPELTASRFVPDPFSTTIGSRLYKTGDLGRWRADGAIEYLGRNDQQIKLRGFRIELGEIESHILRSGVIRDAVVSIRGQQAEDKRLVAYIVPGKQSQSFPDVEHSDPKELVRQWQSIYDNSYSIGTTSTAPDFAGWNSSYTGLPIPLGEMQGWLQSTIDRIGELLPRRVLEVGCGVGLLVEKLAGRCQLYHATDISQVAVAKLRDWLTAQPLLQHVAVFHRQAIDLEGMSDEPYDTIILNSVTQHFPDVNYLLSFIEKAIERIAENGQIFIGDVRNLDLQTLLHSSVQLAKASGSLSTQQLQQRIRKAQSEEKQLVLSPEFFRQLPTRFGRISDVDVELKRGEYVNELSTFRYDVVLHVGRRKRSTSAEVCGRYESAESVSQIARQLQERKAAALGLSGVPNSRLAHARAVVFEIGRGHQRVEGIREALQDHTNMGHDPEFFWTLGKQYGYETQVAWSDVPSRSDGNFDVLFVDPTRSTVSEGAIRQATVLQSPDISLANYANDPSAPERKQQLAWRIREYLRSRVPDYMIPSAFVVLDTMPLTPNGKVDRRALADLETDVAVGASREYEAPNGPIEERLAEIWQQLLGIERVSRNDNFFELGGNSLQVIKMVNELRTSGVDADVRGVFQCKTIAALGKSLTVSSNSRTQDSTSEIPPDSEEILPEMLPLINLDTEQILGIVKDVPGGPRNIRDIYPLTPLQEGILFQSLLQEGSVDTYTVSVLLSFGANYETKQLSSAFQSVVNRHDALRSAFFWEGLPRPVQVVCRHVDLRVGEVALEQVGDPIEELHRQMKLFDQRFDLNQAPLMRLTVFIAAESARRYVALHLHHIIHDNISLKLMLSEVQAFLRSANPQLPAPVPYRRHVVQALEYASRADSELFFKRKLEDVEEPTAPFGLADLKGGERNFGEHIEALDPALISQVRLQSRRMGVSVASFFHAIWALVVSNTSGRDDVVYGTVLSGRHQGAGVGGSALGMYVNTLPIRMQLRNRSVVELVTQSQQELVELLEHEQSSLGEAQRQSGVSAPQPLFGSIFNYLHAGELEQATAPVTAGRVAILAIKGRTNYPITLLIEDHGEKVVLIAQTDARIDPRRIVRYVSIATQSVVDALDTRPTALALSLGMLPPEERHQVLSLFNQTYSTYPRDTPLHEIFQERVQRAPYSIAVTHGQDSLTYIQLNERANRLAHLLEDRGIRDRECVPIVMSRSLLEIVAQLAVLKCGAAYVPIDPAFPPERRAFMIRDCGARIVLSDSPAPDPLDGTLIWVDCLACESDLAKYSELNLPELSGATDTCYVMYTSGSTGEPKGVLVPHRAVSRLVINNQYLAVSGTDCFAHGSNSAFDASTLEIWGALLNGARVAIIDPPVVLDGNALGDAIQGQGVTVLWLSVGLLAQHLDALAGVVAKLRYLITGGDVVDPSIGRRFSFSELPENFLNGYGPTECTTFSTIFRINDLPEEATTIPIGRPISNTRIYILNPEMQPVPIGALGEVYIGGDGVALGYMKRSAQSEQRFLTDPFAAGTDARLYRSGDLAVWRPDGIIEFKGRNDGQVKIRGYRVEVGEIESHLRAHENVSDVLVTAREAPDGERLLVAYIVPHERSDVSGAALRKHLRALLPEYMVPRAFVFLDRFPLTANGKVDRRALPDPSLEAVVKGQDESTAPNGPVELALAKLWRELLRAERVGREDNFFALGGHSMMVIKALGQINKLFHGHLKITDIYRNPTIASLAKTVSEGTVGEHLVDLSKEAILDPDIRPRIAHVTRSSDAVLLTGCTGLVGRFLLRELLETQGADIYCILRCQNDSQGKARLRAILRKWKLWLDRYDRRIFVIPGDLRQPHLSIDEDRYRRLSESVHTVYHCATSMNHLETYAMAKAANVEGVQELLKLATSGRQATVNYVSTLGVFSPHTQEGVRTVDERTAIDQESHYASDGYNSSKWVGEKLILRAAEIGMPANVFRLGLVWPDTELGRYDELQHGYRLLKSCFLSGLGIKDYHLDMPPTPVDYVARAIVSLANRHTEGMGRFHISASQPLSRGLFEQINEVTDLNLELLEFEEWRQEIKRIHGQGVALPVVPLIDVYDYNPGSKPASVRYDCKRTELELDQNGVAAPEFEAASLRRLVKSMFENDFDLQDTGADRPVRSRAI